MNDMVLWCTVFYLIAGVIVAIKGLPEVNDVESDIPNLIKIVLFLVMAVVLWLPIKIIKRL